MGWQWHRTRRLDSARVDRHWLVLAVATLWVLAHGTLVEEAHLRGLASGRVQRPPLESTVAQARPLSLFQRVWLQPLPEPDPLGELQWVDPPTGWLHLCTKMRMGALPTAVRRLADRLDCCFRTNSKPSSLKVRSGSVSVCPVPRRALTGRLAFLLACKQMHSVEMTAKDHSSICHASSLLATGWTRAVPADSIHRVLQS